MGVWVCVCGWVCVCVCVCVWWGGVCVRGTMQRWLGHVHQLLVVPAPAADPTQEVERQRDRVSAWPGCSNWINTAGMQPSPGSQHTWLSARIFGEARGQGLVWRHAHGVVQMEDAVGRADDGAVPSVVRVA